MTIRERQEALEEKILSPYATLSSRSKGRAVPEPPDEIRPVFQRDRDRILHSKSLRRLKHKTQVFFRPKGDHYRTRLTHTLEVSQISRTIAVALNMNESLTEAIALGHDLGHTPFGHSGEAALDAICSFGFKHAEQSVRIVELLEKDGKGLNLTYEVRDGIRNHSLSTMPSTPEGKIVRLSDKIAYINHDIDDAIRGHLITEEDIPLHLRETMGMDNRERLDTLVNAVIYPSLDKGDVIMDPVIYEAMLDMRNFMFDNVYINRIAKAEEKKAQDLVAKLFEHFMKHPEEMSEEFRKLLDRGETRERVVCDYVAGMTDQYAIDIFRDIFLPTAWSIY
ncbi:MAG: deoxyguanosinetriphosphate triphosphohydrolase [Lachnospiraceae bacterium]|nr:deoxyguanosinetriphosphate triphosphohydrolase [Lachnospiraceae bacterium]